MASNVGLPTQRRPNHHWSDISRVVEAMTEYMQEREASASDHHPMFFPTHQELRGACRFDLHYALKVRALIAGCTLVTYDPVCVSGHTSRVQVC